MLYARTKDEYPVAIKVVHKPMMYRRPNGRSHVLVEKESLERLTTMRMPFVTKLLSSWDDGENVYFVMVSDFCTS